MECRPLLTSIDSQFVPHGYVERYAKYGGIKQHIYSTSGECGTDYKVGKPTRTYDKEYTMSVLIRPVSQVSITVHVVSVVRIWKRARCLVALDNGQGNKLGLEISVGSSL